MTPLVSVIVPCFNGEAYLRDAIDSALGQTEVVLEIVVVDDGSTDGSAQILASYGNRIRAIRQPNSGVARARNAGIAASRGAFIAFLDCDDVWLPQKLARQIELFGRDPELGLVYSDCQIFSDAGVLVASKRAVRAPAEGHVLQALFRDNFITTSSTVVRRDCLDRVGVFREAGGYAEDYDLWLRLAERYRFGYVDAVAVCYRIRPGQLSDNVEQRYLDDIALLKEWVERVPGWSQKTPVVRRRFGALYFRLGRRCLKAGAPAKARLYLMHGLGYRPIDARTWLFVLLALLPAAAVRHLQALRSVVSGRDRADGPISVVMVSSGFYPKVGGTERQAELLARALQRLGVAVEVVALRFRPDLARVETLSGLRVVRISYPRVRLVAPLVAMLKLALYLVRFRCRYDVVHVHMVGYLAFVATLTARLLRKPIVLKFAVRPPSEQASFDFPQAVRSWPFLERILTGGVRRADRFIAISAMIREMACEGGVPAERIVSIPNAVDLELYRPAAGLERERLRRALGLRAGRVVVFSGRIVRRKGVGDLLQAWANVAARHPDATLYLIGAGRDQDEMRACADRAGVSGSVEFRGVVENVSDWLRAADLFVLPSHFEGMPNALLEAMACGLPSVATRVSGIVDLLEHGRNGLIVEPGQPKQIADAVNQLLEDRDLGDRIGAEARRSVERGYSTDSIARRYLDLYRELLA